MTQEEKEIIQGIIDILHEEFNGTKFIACWDHSSKKWVIYCNDFFVYKTPEYRETMETIRDHFPDIKMYSCVIANLTLSVLKRDHNEDVIITKV